MRNRVCCVGCSLLALAMLGYLCPNSAIAKETKKHHASQTDKDANKDAKKKDAAPGDASAKHDASKKPAKDAAAKDSAAGSKPATAKVKKGLFRIEVDLDGVFEAQNMTELCLRPQEWNGLSVLKAIEHGTAVKQGELLVALDMEKIDHAIADQEKDVQIAELSFKQAEEALQAVEKSTPLDLEAAQRSNRIAQEDLKHFNDVGRGLSLKMADFTVEYCKNQLEYQEEELRQLEKMYKAGDVNVETEAIVLKRARDTVKLFKFLLEMNNAQSDVSRKYFIPREEERIKDAAVRTDMASSRAKITLPVALNKQRLELEKLKIQQTLAHERLHKLIEDRAAMTVKAPCDGIVYYGKCVRGKWSGSGVETLRHGSGIQPNDVFMTIVQSRPLLVHVTVPEAQLQNVRAGLAAVVEPTDRPQQTLTAIVERVGTVPITSGSFDARLTLALDGQSESLMPGMACEVKTIAYKNEHALTIPPKAVFTDDLDLQKRYVYLAGKKEKDKPTKRDVTVGKRNDKQVEILSGLAAGDEVLLDRPKEE